MAAIRFCEICKDEIDKDRADGLPDTRLCTKHAKECLEFGGEFMLFSQQETTSKKGSLKKNYGSVSIERKRNKLAIEKLRNAWEQQQA